MDMTALSLVREAYLIQQGNWTMLHAAAGAVGLIMYQLPRAFVTKTIATAGEPEKVELSKKMVRIM